MNEKAWGQQQSDGSLVFAVRIRNLPAASCSAAHVAREVCRILTVELTVRYDFAVIATVAEDFMGEGVKRTPGVAREVLG